MTSGHTVAAAPTSPQYQMVPMEKHAPLQTVPQVQVDLNRRAVMDTYELVLCGKKGESVALLSPHEQVGLNYRAAMDCYNLFLWEGKAESAELLSL